MRFLNRTMFVALLGATAAFGQQKAPETKFVAPRFDLGLGYNYTGANAPPGGCPCFSMQGGFLSADLQVTNWLGFTGKVTVGHATDISELGQNLTLTTFLGGPKVSLQRHRVVPFGQFLAGGARGTGSYFPTSTGSSTSASSFAFSTGGGLDINLTHRFAIRAVDAEYLHTGFPNGVQGTQNQVEVGAGIVFKFGGHAAPPQQAAKPEPPRSLPEFHFTCSASQSKVDPGRPVDIVGQAFTLPDHLDVQYNWTTNGGVIHGEGRIIMIDTAGLAAGDYQVTGHATLTENPEVSANCTASFHIEANSAPPASAGQEINVPPSGPAVSDEEEKAFHEHVKDVFFNYDKYDLRADAKPVLAKDAEYLKAHPEIKIVIGGHSDERGSTEYNLALSLKRATSARDALVEAGVAESRIQVISYGKERPFCTEEAESCFQLNRRAQLSPAK